MKKVLVTSALPYANGSIHLGHLVEYIQTDIYVRFRKMLGDDVVYVCADDTHGTPIEVNARSRGITPEELVAFYGREHKEDFDAFGVNFDIFYSTNSDENRRYAELVFERLKEKGHILQKKIPLNWCDKDQRFLPDRYIKGNCPKCGAADQYGDVCEKCNSTYEPTELKEPYCVICGGAPKVKESTHYFFRLSDFDARLREWTTRPGVLQDEIRNYVTAWMNDGLKDWCISRNGPYFGFRIPGEDDLYFYVWLDAPIGYLASLDRLCRDTGRDVNSYLTGPGSEMVHFIGKDITYFHALFWPATLMGAGFNVPTSLFVHGMLTVNGEKMSKSRGTFITARQYLSSLDPQHLRYYYASNLSSKPDDIDLNMEDFRNRVNAELVGNVSNLTYRALSFCIKQLEGRVSTFPDNAPTAAIESAAAEVRGYYEAREFRKAIQRINAMCAVANKYFQDSAPWALIKTDPEAARKVITWCASVSKVLAVLLKPVLPKAAESIERQLGLKTLMWSDAVMDYTDRKIHSAEMLAVKVEQENIDRMLAYVPVSTGPGTVPAKAAAAAEPFVAVPEITYDDFAKLDLRVAEILEAERVPKSKKLVRLQVDCGERRQIVAGIGEAFEPADLVGKKIMVIVNLKPAKLMGVESRGMLL
ncbi:MAG: methionine--tRNA ligase, partial [Myxococcota bacterium]